MNDTYRHIRSLAEPVLEGMGCFLVDVKVESDASGTVLWMLVDAEAGGVTLETCSNLSREIGFLLDAHGVMEGGYRLNVSSPGLDRPLSDRRQFPKNVGRRIRIRLKAAAGMESQAEKLEGVLEGVSDSILQVRSGSNLREVPMDNVAEALVIPVF